MNNDVLRANRDFVHFLNLDTLSSVRRLKYSGIICKMKGSSNTSNVDLSSVSISKLNNDVKRYSRIDLLYASYDVNDLFVFDDVSIRNSRVSKMPFRKKPRDSLNVRSKSNSNNTLPRTLFRWLPKIKPLAEPVAKWIPKVKRKFNGKDDEGFLVGYSVSSKAFRVFKSRTRIVQETLHIIFLENQPNVAGSGPTWLFDIDTLTQSINYQPAVAGNQPNHTAGIQGNFDAGKAVKETESASRYVLLPLWSTGSKDPQNIDVDTVFHVKEPESEVHVSPSSSDKTKKHDEKTKKEAKGKKDVYFDASMTFHHPSNVHTFYQPYPHEKKWTKDHLLHKEIFDPKLSVRTRGQLANSCLIACLLSSIEPANMAKALKDTFAPVTQIKAIRFFLAYAAHKDFTVFQMDVKTTFLNGILKEEVYVGQPLCFVSKQYPNNVYALFKALYGLKQVPQACAMQDELDQFARLKVWRLVPRPEVTQIKAIRFFLAYAAHKDFTVFQMDVKTTFLHGILKEEVYVGQPLCFVSKQYPDHVYALDKALYGLKQVPQAWYDVLSKFLIDSGF
nr:hypothetical protein [Tanacetum cinerariifolium]